VKDWQITYFLSVARNLNFTKSADELHVSQPAISRQISVLEDELGVSLFDRTTRSMKLTPAGMLFYETFSDFKTKFAETMEKAKALTGQLYGIISVGYQAGWNLTAFYTEIKDRLNSSYPNIKLKFEGKEFFDLINCIKNNQLDVILSPNSSLSEIDGLVVQPLSKILLVLFYSAQLLPPGTVNPALIDFKDYTFFAPSHSSRENRSAEKLIEYCTSYGFTPKIEFVPDMETAIFSVQNNLGVVIGDNWYRETANRDFHYITLDSAAVSIAWLKKNSNPAIPIFANELLSIFSNGA
jgi:DNA-binding transcriptional LysR family regulator